MSDRAEDLNEWRSEQYAKNAKSYEPKVWLTVEEAKDILHSLNCTWSRCPVKAECKDLVKKKIKQAEK